MPDMTRDEMIEGLLHEITRAHCHLEDTDRDLGVVADDLDELMTAVDPSTAQLLGPFAAASRTIYTISSSSMKPSA